jgi:osomolarity two-component system sensor histidine kinase SLN1
MGGKIQLESRVGVGSTFTMQIPLKFVKELADSATSSSQQGGSMQNSRRNSVSIKSLTTEEPPKATGDATQKITINNASPIGFEQDKNPRLVGLSQPFFASSPTSSPPNGLEVTTTKDDKNEKIRVLVAEDNMVNQEVVLRMLKLEEIYGAFFFFKKKKIIRSS